MRTDLTQLLQRLDLVGVAGHAAVIQRWQHLPVPQPKRGFDVSAETWTLEPNALHVSIDLTPDVSAMVAGQARSGNVEGKVLVDFSDPLLIGLLDVDALYADLLVYKSRRQYGNVFIPRGVTSEILKNNDLFLLRADVTETRVLHEGALRLLQTYLDRWVARAEREAEGSHLTLDGYILTDTDLHKIPGAEHETWSDLGAKYRILRQDGNYVETMLQVS